MRIKYVLIVFFILASLTFAKGGQGMKLISPAFSNNSFIPKEYTGLGADVNPPLVIENIPVGAKSLALIVDDPDAPAGTWVHWVVFDIPVVSKIDKDSIPGKFGMTDSGRPQYHGPNPPSGTHRYFFKIYALDKILGLKEGINKQTLEKAMQGHILDKAELIGLFKK